MQRASNNSLAEALERYLAWLQLERGASPKTIESYSGDLHQFLAFAHARKIENYSEISMTIIGAYLAHLTTLKLKVASASRKITSLRTFLKFLFTQQIITEDFTERIATPKQRRKLPETLSMNQLDKLFAAIPETPVGIRDRAIVELMFGSGLRVSEITGLKLTDIDEENDFLRVFGKGSKERIVPLGSKAKAAIKHYVDIARPHFMEAVVRPFKTSNSRGLKSHGYTPTSSDASLRDEGHGGEAPDNKFPLHEGEGQGVGEKKRTPTAKLKATSTLFIGERGGALARCSIWYALKSYARRAGLPPTLIHPHILRHSFATELLKGGADLRLIQGLLGHSSISTTQIYTSVEPSHLIEVHEKFHPRKGMKV
jgi:integrase/recombinase XerD